MTKAELIATEPKVKDNKLFIIVKFSEMARWAPKLLLSLEVPIEDYMAFLEKNIESPENAEYGSLSVEVQKSQNKLIGNKTYYFTLSKSQWKKFIQVEVEKLYLQGIIKL